jgi:hypothetical protein
MFTDMLNVVGGKVSGLGSLMAQNCFILGLKNLTVYGIPSRFTACTTIFLCNRLTEMLACPLSRCYWKGNVHILLLRSPAFRISILPYSTANLL